MGFKWHPCDFVPHPASRPSNILKGRNTSRRVAGIQLGCAACPPGPAASPQPAVPGAHTFYDFLDARGASRASLAENGGGGALMGPTRAANKQFERCRWMATLVYLFATMAQQPGNDPLVASAHLSSSRTGAYGPFQGGYGETGGGA